MSCAAQNAHNFRGEQDGNAELNAADFRLKNDCIAATAEKMRSGK
jgi:hypothetical protein